MTIVWSYRYMRGERIIVDSDTILNTDDQFAWDWSGTAVPDANTAPPADNSDAYDCDVQNIMTHEAGHWLMLLDLYDTGASEQTMYGYASDGELKAISLESGDIAGISAVYSK